MREFLFVTAMADLRYHNFFEHIYSIDISVHLISILFVRSKIHYFDQGVLIQSPVFFFSSTGAFLLLAFFATTFFCISFFGATFALEPTLKEPIPPEVGGFGPSNPPDYDGGQILLVLIENTTLGTFRCETKSYRFLQSFPVLHPV